MNKQKLVLVGNGMAGVRCIENIIKKNPDAYEITIFGSEPHPNYSRIMLSSVLQGGTAMEDIILHPRSWYEINGIHLYTGETVIKIDKEAKRVITSHGREVLYDKLIMATGSTPFILPLPGVEKEGVISFRTIEDCQKMMKAASHYKKAVVIGGGLLGLEAARGLLHLGMEVDVVHLSDCLMERQLDTPASNMLRQELEKQGMNFLLKKASEEIIGTDRAEGIRFKDGSQVKADLVVMAVGVKPNIELAIESGIETNRGIVVNDVLATDSPDIYALGECAEHNGKVYGLVKPLYDQGEVLAACLCGIPTKGYHGSVLSTQLKISGVELFSVGDFISNETTKAIQFQNDIDSVYKKVFFRGNKAVGAVLFGDTREGPNLFDTIVKQKVVPDRDKAVLLESTDPADSFVASLPAGEHICTCNSVSKGAIIKSVQENQLSTVEEVKVCTQASSSCGGCKPAISQLLAYMDSDRFDEPMETKVTLCDCTAYTEDEVVERIQMDNLANPQKIMDVLGWKDKNGCRKCRPALDYYLEMIYPEYEKETSNLFLNEKMNAIQRQDGTYTIIPQFYGGVLGTEQLRNITDVATKYKLSSIAVASDQRIHLTGIEKNDLPIVWSELDMPLKSMTGHMVETIKTSIGEHICNCDKNLSVQLAEVLEQKTEFLKTPYRVKIGISACIHNGAGSTTKDVGAIKMERGWEVYVGGSSGRNARTGELLCVVASFKDVVGIIAGFVQYYRESAYYQERTWQWIERAGLIHIREALFDEELREDLLERLESDVSQRKRHTVIH